MPRPSSHRPSAARLAFDFVLVSAIWGSTWFIIKDQLDAAPLTWSVTWRFLFAAIGMFAYALWRRESLRLPWQGQVVAATMGLAHFCLNFQFLYASERHVTSGVVAVGYALVFVPAAILSWIFLKGRPGGRFFAGSAIAIVGISLLLWQEVEAAPVQGDLVLGIALMAGGILCSAVFNTVQGTEAARRQPIVPLLAWALGWGALLDILIALAVAGPPVFAPTWGYFGGVLYLSLVGSVLTFPLFGRLIREIGAERASYTAVAIPIVAMILSTLFEGYRWTVLSVAGAAIAVVGLAVALSARRS